MEAMIFDAESTGKVEPEPIETAWMFVGFGRPSTVISDAECVRLKPSKSIELGALAAHGILDEELSECEESAMFEAPLCSFWIGHNCDYDWELCGKPPGAKRICTLALARELWPTLDCHTQSALIYHLDRQNARQRLQGAHGAACDVMLCKTILDAILDERPAIDSWEALWKFSEYARVPRVLTFGKHKGLAIADAPADYRNWLLRANDPPIDDYLRRAITESFGQRTLFCPQ